MTLAFEDPPSFAAETPSAPTGHHHHPSSPPSSNGSSTILHLIDLQAQLSPTSPILPLNQTLLSPDFTEDQEDASVEVHPRSAALPRIVPRQNPNNLANTPVLDHDHYTRPAPLEELPFLPPDLPLLDEIFKTRVPTFRHVPKSSKNEWAKLFAEVTEAAAGNPGSVGLWTMLYMLPKCILFAPLRGRRMHFREMHKVIQERISLWRGGHIGQLWQQASSPSPQRQSRKQSARDKPPPSQDDINARRCLRLLQDGQFSRAAQALSSSGIDFDSPAAYASMQDKHPQCPTAPTPSGLAPAAMTVTAKQVIQALKSFKTGSAPGPSGLRAEHLKGAVFCPTASRAERALQALTTIVNVLASGKAPQEIVPFFFGANLLAARKKNGGHRPIAVGEVLRRLVSKCLAFEVAPRAALLLKPLQLGVGIPGGCEGIIHAMNAIFNDGDIPVEDKWVLLLDFENAFNLIDRETVFEQVRQHFPELSAWVELCYGTQAHLLFGQALLLSCMGLHQGDPLAALLFALALLPLLLLLKASVPALLAQVWLLDDGTLVGNRDDLVQALEIVEREGPPRGLHLNHRKCLLWCGQHTPANLNALGRPIPRADEGGYELLGAPVGVDAFAATILEKRISAIRDLTMTKLPNLHDSQAEFCLLRSCFSIPKFGYCLRTCEPTKHASRLAAFDGTIRDALSSILARPLNPGQWMQATLPVPMGGLGLRSATSHASAAFVSSLAQTHSLVTSILSKPGYNRDFSQALTNLNASSHNSFTTLEEVGKTTQAALSLSIDLKVQEELLASTADPRTRALLNSVSLPHSGDWLNVVPNPALGLKINHVDFRLAALYRIGVPIYSTSGKCPTCPADNDIYGDHAILAQLMARGSPATTDYGTCFFKRHHLLRWRPFGNDGISSLMMRKDQGTFFFLCGFRAQTLPWTLASLPLYKPPKSTELQHMLVPLLRP